MYEGVLSVICILLYCIVTSGIPWGEKALKGGTTSETFSYPGGSGSNNDELKIWKSKNKLVETESGKV